MTVLEWIAVCAAVGYVAFAFVVVMEVFKDGR